MSRSCLVWIRSSHYSAGKAGGVRPALATRYRETLLHMLLMGLLVSSQVAEAQLSGRIPQPVEFPPRTTRVSRTERFEKAIARLRLTVDSTRPADRLMLDSVTVSLRVMDAAEARNLGTPVDENFVDAILARFQPDATKRKPVLEPLKIVLNKGTIDQPAIATLVATAEVKPPLTELAATVLAMAASGVAETAIKKATGITDYFLTSAATSVGADRALATSNFIEFPFKRGALRFVTTAAVSNADSGSASGQASLNYRTRTADLLTMMQTGGNGVLRLFLDLSPHPGKSGGFHASAVMDAGVMGDWLNANTTSRFTGGGALEATLAVETPYSPNLPEPVSLFFSMRLGGRWSGKGIVSDDLTHKTLTFAQALLEFRLPGGKIPLGISVNLVDHLKEYSLPIHVYTNVGR